MRTEDKSSAKKEIVKDVLTYFKRENLCKHDGIVKIKREKINPNEHIKINNKHFELPKLDMLNIS